MAVPVVGLLLATLAVAISRPGDPLAGFGWSEVWRDDFDAAAGTRPDGAHWIFDRGHNYPGGQYGWGNDELQSYTDSPANVATDGDGNLRITATRSPEGLWESARIETQRLDFAPPPDGDLKIEARIELPAGGPGIWPAFWALGGPYRDGTIDWPAVGEIDILENINNGSTAYGSLHCLSDRPSGCGPGDALTGATPLKGPAGTVGMHTYTLLWEAGERRVRWFLDGEEYWRVTEEMLGRESWNRTFGHGYYLLLNVAVGGNWPGPPDATTPSGASMVVDYVSVSQRGG